MLLQPATPPTLGVPQVPPEIATCGQPTSECDRRGEGKVWQEYVANAQPGDIFRVPFHPIAVVLETIEHPNGITYLTSRGSYFVAFDPGLIGNPCDEPTDGSSCEPTTPSNDSQIAGYEPPPDQKPPRTPGETTF